MTAGSPRDQMVEAASRLFARQGYRATTMRGIVDESGAPWGSLAHYWPGGKEQIGVAAVQYGDQRVRGVISLSLERATSPGDAVARYLGMVGKVLEATDFAEGCPVTTVALEVASDGTKVTEACAAAYDAWRSMWAEAFRSAGMSAKQADGLSTTVVSGINGALILARLQRSRTPLRLAGDSLRSLVDTVA